MTQLEQVKQWIGGEWAGSMYSFNTTDDRYYGYTFYKRTAWDGMFLNNLDYLKQNYKHVIDLATGKEV